MGHLEPVPTPIAAMVNDTAITLSKEEWELIQQIRRETRINSIVETFNVLSDCQQFGINRRNFGKVVISSEHSDFYAANIHEINARLSTADKINHHALKFAKFMSEQNIDKITIKGCNIYAHCDGFHTRLSVECSENMTAYSIMDALKNHGFVVNDNIATRVPTVKK